LSSIFRTIHTIKGTSGFFGFHKLESVAHVGENLLSRLRDGELVINPEIASALLALVDAIRKMLAAVEQTSQEGPEEYKELCATLTRLNEGKPAAKAPEALAVQAEKSLEAGNEAAPPPPVPATTPAPVAAVPPPAAPVQGAPKPSMGEILVQKGVAKQEHIEDAVQKQAAGDPRHIGEILIEQGAVRSEDVKEALQVQQEHVRASAVSESNIRVDVQLLDKLMNLVGELVLARNQILQFTATQEDSSFVAASQRLNLVTTELQEGVMKTRMQPIGNIWNKFPRVVRDLAAMCGKQVELEMEGKETELDKTIIEAIKDPLTHVLRNCVDHGIESPEARIKKGKPAMGRVLMRAFHEGGQVNIEIIDDGGGIDTDKVKKKALLRGLITADQSEGMSHREAVNLIFLPGFSTAEKVTNVSGRGVGMDVVKTNIERIGGTVDILTALGEGTTLKIKIPLTLAIIPALIVTSGGERFAIPQVSLLELVRLEGEAARKGIEKIHGAPVYRLRGNLLPVVYLNQQLQMDTATVGAEKVLNIVVLRADDRQFGMVVDGINDTEEIVVKPLGKQLKSISVFAGATIMGDGKVALILDVLGLAQHAHVVSATRDRNLAEGSKASSGNVEDRQTMLVFSAGAHGRMAIQLAQVARLEEFRHDAVEHTGAQEVVQYRGQIMPLVRLREVLFGTEEAAPASDTMQIVVYSNNGRFVGLVVDQICDIVHEAITIKHNEGRAGMLGSAVIQGRVTEMLDVEGAIKLAQSRKELALA